MCFEKLCRSMRKRGGWGIDDHEDEHGYDYDYDRADDGDGMTPMRTMKTTMRRPTRKTMMTIMMIITINDDGDADDDVKSCGVGIGEVDDAAANKMVGS